MTELIIFIQISRTLFYLAFLYTLQRRIYAYAVCKELVQARVIPYDRHHIYLRKLSCELDKQNFELNQQFKEWYFLSKCHFFQSAIRVGRFHTFCFQVKFLISCEFFPSHAWTRWSSFISLNHCCIFGKSDPGNWYIIINHGTTHFFCELRRWQNFILFLIKGMLRTYLYWPHRNVLFTQKRGIRINVPLRNRLI